ncbi:MAG: DsbA family protein [Alphaproteobacteria bacterium]|nr:DsbA family protein [Alphaproteobacteria bacterium]
MRVVFSLLLAAGLSVLPLSGGRAAETPVFSPAQVEALEKIIRKTIVDHPEILVEAAQALQEKAEGLRSAQARAAIAKLRPELERDPDAPVLGNPSGDVSVVMFFDYNCAYCKLVYRAVTKVVADDGKVRLVLKELPILGPDSLTASKAALAAGAQGKYREFFSEAMGHRGKFDDGALEGIVKTVGLDHARLTKDMAADGIEKALDRNRDLSRALDINGTPAFVIGSDLVAGALNEKTLKEMIAKARRSSP